MRGYNSKCKGITLREGAEAPGQESPVWRNLLKATGGWRLNKWEEQSP